MNRALPLTELDDKRFVIAVGAPRGSERNTTGQTDRKSDSTRRGLRELQRNIDFDA
jgi:hypothetical protein